MKTCTRCGESKPYEEYYKWTRSKDGYQHYCIECDKQAKRDYYQRNKEKTKADVIAWQSENHDKVKGYKRNWKRNNPEMLTVYKHTRRAREYQGGTWTAQEWADLCERYGNACLGCGSTVDLSVDHVIPLADGGSNTIDNLQPLCVACNCKKGRRTIDYRAL